MEFLKLAQERFSVRAFKTEKVEREKIDLILKAGQVAPTACNYQPQRIYVIESDEALAKLKKCTGSHFNCPLAMLVCFNKDEDWTRNFDGQESGWVDASIVQTHLMLEAAELGVGSTWVMHFIPEAVREEFALAENEVPVGILVMGYPKDDVKPNPLHNKIKPLEETVKFI